MSPATTRPDSSRKTRSTASNAGGPGRPMRSTGVSAGGNARWTGVRCAFLGVGEVDYRPDLDCAARGTGDLRRPLDGLVKVRGLDHVEAAELFLRLGERTVGDERLPVSHAHARGH